MNLGRITARFRERLNTVMPSEEASAVTVRVLERLLGCNRIDLVLKKDEAVDEEHRLRLEAVLNRLLDSEPVQYILGTAPFLGRDYSVNPAVLIPRPETEELVLWMLETAREIPSGRMIDFGTGSGCIPVSFFLEKTDWEVIGTDISSAALEVAAGNARHLGASVTFQTLDMLAYDAATCFPPSTFQLMVSNPPYIPETEAPSLEQRVRGFEPSLALFTPEDDPQLFYRALQRLAATLLVPGGYLFLEVHERYARETLRLFVDDSFSNAELRTDLSGKPRMIRVRKASS